jgi:hypothetical protein
VEARFPIGRFSVDSYQRPNINPQEPGEGSRFLGFFCGTQGKETADFSFRAGRQLRKDDK